MPISITYIAVAILAMLGVENADQVVEAAFIIVTAAVALWGRYRAGGLNVFGLRK